MQCQNKKCKNKNAYSKEYYAGLGEPIVLCKECWDKFERNNNKFRKKMIREEE